MFKKILFQIHWFIGITAGTLLMLVGLTGAVLSFRDEIIEALNPGVMTVARQPAPPLDAPQLIARIQTAYPDRPVLAATLSADDAGSAQVHAARINFVAPPGARRGELRYADPYSAALLPPLRAQPFFQWVERLHRFLLLPTPTGKLIMGSAAMCLLLLALSGLYLRWPRQALQWRAWFRLDFGLQGRSFLWHLHSMLGTWALLMYLVFSVTGMYWSFDWVKNGLNRLVAETPALKTAVKANGAKNAKSANKAGAAPAGQVLQADQLARVWRGFSDAVPTYGSVTLRLPERAGEPVQVSYLDVDAPHEHARNRMRIDPATGAVSDHSRYNDKSTAGRLVGSVYPLHMGTYFGLPGRIVMTVAALGLPLFGVTGWMLYLDRRRKKSVVARERLAMSASSGAQTDAGVLIVFATQSGYAEQIALRTAAALHAAGVAVNVRSIARLGLEQLRQYRHALFVVSSFGDGDPPDSARGFMRQLMHQSGAALAHLHYGVLALGDRRYRKFCGYGHTLDHHLQNRGARSRFAMVEVDKADPVALARWQRPLADFCGVAEIGMPIGVPDAAAPATAAHYENWQLTERIHLNPGSQGEPIFHLALSPPAPGRQWPSGALAEILPRHAPQQVSNFLQEADMDGAAPVWFQGARCTLAEALAGAVLPAPGGPSLPPQSLADTLTPLTPRRYSVASIAADRTLQLLVRQSLHEGRLGLASGWLTAHAAVGDTIECRLLDNPGFALSQDDAPGIFIGNGSGMAGLRSHLRARAQDRTGRRNWLLFGERNRAHDFHYGDEIAQWQRDAVLTRVDLAFSRDRSEPMYVQDKLRQASASVREWIADGAVIYVCGSMDGMAAGVDAALNDILGEDGVEQLIAADRYRRDVY